MFCTVVARSASLCATASTYSRRSESSAREDEPTMNAKFWPGPPMNACTARSFRSPTVSWYFCLAASLCCCVVRSCDVVCSRAAAASSNAACFSASPDWRAPRRCCAAFTSSRYFWTFASALGDVPLGRCIGSAGEHDDARERRCDREESRRDGEARERSRHGEVPTLPTSMALLATLGRYRVACARPTRDTTILGAARDLLEALARYPRRWMTVSGSSNACCQP